MSAFVRFVLFRGQCPLRPLPVRSLSAFCPLSVRFLTAFCPLRCPLPRIISAFCFLDIGVAIEVDMSRKQHLEFRSSVSASLCIVPGDMLSGDSINLEADSHWFTSNVHRGLGVRWKLRLKSGGNPSASQTWRRGP